MSSLAKTDGDYISPTQIKYNFGYLAKTILFGSHSLRHRRHTIQGSVYHLSD